MIELMRGVGLAAIGTVAFAIILVLPGLGLADRFVGSRRSIAARLILSILISQLLVAGTGIALVAVGRFSGSAIAAIAAILSATSLPTVIRWVRTARLRDRVRWAAPGWIGLLVVPWLALVAAAGWPPADTLQWYYADLGSQLSAAGGIPVSVAEWGLAIRWLPDYLIFNIDTEAYTGLLPFLARADALGAWRVPVAIIGLTMLGLVLRLWLGRPAAAAGLVATAGTVFFLAKFDAYKPEALGIVTGLGALWLIVQGLRHGRSGWVFLGGLSLGVGLAIHVIAATVMGLVVVGFVASEWLALRRSRATRLGWLVRAALLGVLLSVAMGVGIQGRATVAPAALNPAIQAGADPTWTFFLRSTGDFAEPERAPPARPIAGGVTSPWAGLRITSAFGWWLLPVVAIGLAAVLGIGGRRRRWGLGGLVLSATLILVGVLFFALRFETYVPRWTGLVRFGQYAPLVAGFGVAFAIQGYLRTWSWLVERRIPALLLPVVAVAGALWLGSTASTRYAEELPISPAGRAALERLRSVGRPGDVVLSNVLTTGTIEFFTGLEDPLEGRQPLIEEPAVLAATNQLLLDAHRFFELPSDGQVIDRLAVRWVLVADDPRVLGGTALLGGTVAAMSVPSLHQVWSADGIALFEVVAPSRSSPVTDARVALTNPVRVFVAGLAALLGALALVDPTGAANRLRRGVGRGFGRSAGRRSGS
jgi:hypothetical protein